MSLGSPDVAVDLIDVLGLRVGMLLLHSQNQTGNGVVVQIVSIFKLNTRFFFPYLSMHVFCQLSQPQTDKTVIDVFPLKRRHLFKGATYSHSALSRLRIALNSSINGGEGSS